METISENQRKVLECLAEIYEHEANCKFFDGIAEETKLEKRLVRLACRALARKGLAKYERGLFFFGGERDGEMAGSGYGATEKGVSLIKTPLQSKKNV